ncbi:cache domain-containing protein [Poseidonibacter sp. 1_MG-2023]|uniref:sensor domain-containing diguanylate cyclase n=1 Tax=Poseidonibacter TaxID=2321187 RepID=UPI0026E461FC|nr:MULTISPECIES: cache domain-containing protein [Poseidonibacter]MDO6827186.1 cache domain-containing protein [Poseidonibacter sp. 1_MG-2023]
MKSQYEKEVQQLIIDEEVEVMGIVKNRIENIINLLEKNYNQKIEAEKEEIKNTINIAYNVIENTYYENKNDDKKNILLKINKQLRNQRFYDNASGYYFIYSNNGTSILHPHLPHLEGTNFSTFKDESTKLALKKLLLFLEKKNAGYVSWKWYKPNKNTEKKSEVKEKIGYLKKFAPLNIFIGSAKYKDDIELSVKKNLQELLNIIRYDKDNYIFAYDELGNTISHIKKDLIGKNRWDISSNGRLLMQEIIKKAFTTDGSYIKYLATINPSTKESSNKISYVKLFSRTNWAIGTGMYNSIIFENIKNKQKLMKKNLDNTIYKVIIYSFLITSFSLLIMILISRKVGDIIKKYKDHLTEINNTLELKVKDRTKELEDSKNLLKEMTLRDPLTNLYNRRYFESIIDELMSLSIREEESLCLIMLDIDKFKNINDNYGHDIGDEVLKKLADNLLSRLRQSDVITRIGGEEFAIVFPKTSIDGAYKTSEKIRKAVEKLEIKIKENILISFTVSIGIAIFDKNIDKDVHSILKRADIALYQAKDTGRNKVVVFNENKNIKSIKK